MSSAIAASSGAGATSTAHATLTSGRRWLARETRRQLLVRGAARGRSTKEWLDFRAITCTIPNPRRPDHRPLPWQSTNDTNDVMRDEETETARINTLIDCHAPSEALTMSSHTFAYL